MNQDGQDGAYDYVSAKVMRKALKLAWSECSMDRRKHLIDLAVKQINASIDVWPVSKRELNRYIAKLKKEQV